MSGFTKVDNEILEEVAARKFNATQLSVLMIVWRMTLGFNRADHELAINYFVQATGLSKRGVQDAVNSLVEGRVLIVTQEATFNQTRKIAFNKNTGEWRFVSRKELPEVKNLAPDERAFASTVAENCTSPVAESCTQERNIKEISKERDDRTDKPVPYAEYEKLFGTPSPILVDDFDYWIDESQLQDPEEIICEAIKRAKLQTPKYPASYIKTIIEKWISLNLFTISAVREYNAKFDSKIKKSSGKMPSLNEMFDKSNYNKKPVTKEQIEELEKLQEDLPF